MTSDWVKDKTDASAVKTLRASEPVAVHLDIDGTLQVNQNTSPHTQSLQKKDIQHNPPPNALPPINSREAGLRHIVQLQRQLLAQQSDRVQRQRALIIRLNKDLTKIRERGALTAKSEKSKFYDWLTELISFKNTSK